MSRLFNILDGIEQSDFANEILQDTREIVSYADAASESITDDEASRIQAVGLKWRSDRENGNGEWVRMRHEAAAALNDE